MHICIHTYMHSYMYACKYVVTYICKHARTYVSTYVRMYLSMFYIGEPPETAYLYTWGPQWGMSDMTLLARKAPALHELRKWMLACRIRSETVSMSRKYHKLWHRDSLGLFGGRFLCSSRKLSPVLARESYLCGRAAQTNEGIPGRPCVHRPSPSSHSSGYCTSECS